MDKKNKYDWIFFMEWIGTLVVLIGVAMTSYNIYPANLYVGLLGTLMWTVVGWKWQKWSLLVIEAAIAILYVAGILSVR
jgi:hypothetical protein